MDSAPERKLRFSKQRERIYQYMCQSKAHPSAEMIYEDLRAELPSLSLGTVYRNLRQLEELGKVIRVATVDNHERYDAFCEDHVHFVCDSCGKVTDITDADIDSAVTACRLPGGSMLRRISIVIGGLCSNCADC